MSQSANSANIAATLHLTIGLVGLWFLAFWCWRKYRVDSFRHRLFALRDELFDYATSGAISYNDPAYWQLRHVMNGMIRYAHRVTFPRLCLSVVVNMLWPDPCLLNPLSQWVQSVEKVQNQETRVKLLQFNSRVTELMVRHLVTGSPTLLLLLVVFAIVAIFTSAAWAFLKTTGTAGLQLLEAEAASAPGFTDNRKVYA